MNRNLLYTIICFTLFSTGLLAQITLTSDYLPIAGDKIEISEATEFSDITLPASGNHDLDLSELKESDYTVATFFDASTSEISDSFPYANLILKGDEPGTLFYYADATKYEYVGFQGEEYLGIDVPVQMEPASPVLRRKAPFQFGDIFEASFDVQLTFSASELPDSLLNTFPVKPDSIRVSIVSATTNIAEGFGEVTIPGGSYEALRVKSIENRDTQIEGKLGQFWVNLTSLIPNTQLGVRVIETYTYYSNESSTPIAILIVDEEKKLISVSYKKNELTSAFNPSVDYLKSDLRITPNPVIDSSTLNFSNVKKGDYKVKIFNVLGRVVWSNEYKLGGNTKIEVDLNELRKGTYLYSLVDSKGMTIATKRLLVLRP